MSATESAFSPKAFLRSRRPELFSDSVIEQAGALDRSLLEYQLQSLTKRSQEADFERFARRLAEKEICPNLIPHTGPTGGGDSKVDTETYPVADALELAWHVGVGSGAAQERWAFAFSAKEAWRGKVKDDIRKIAGTKRGYKRAFFVSSQFIPDKARAQIEDELTKKHKLKVRILDRQWILDRVFAGGHIALVIEELKLSPGLRTSVRQGAQDLEAERALDETEGRITRATEEGSLNLQFVTDCIEAAKLSRNLERPRTETDGRFARATRAAKEHGTDHQQIVVSYLQAWTNYWWHEDFGAIEAHYDDVEKFATGTENPHELEMLHTLWMVLSGAQTHGLLTVPEEKNKARAAFLVRELARLGKGEGRPSASLHARALRLQMELFEHARAKDSAKLGGVLKKLKAVVREAEGLIGFPVAPLVEVFSELGALLGNLPEYDELFEVAVEVSRKRDGEISAARLLLKRGTDQLAGGQPYEAIRTLGRALRQLYKHESRADLVHALGLCAAAYEEVGLLWAARGSLLCAASIATREFWIHSDVTSLQAACFQRLKWVELMLGRVPHALAWHEVDRAVRRLLLQQGHDAERVWWGEHQFSAMLGILFLRADLATLRELTLLPQALIRLGLDYAAVGLCQALGVEAQIPADLKAGKDAKQLHELFVKWRDQGDDTMLPEAPLTYEQSNVELSTRVLGCRIAVNSQNMAPCVEVAESLLAALESFLATCGFDQVNLCEPEVTVTVRRGDFAPFPLEFVTNEVDGRPHFEITCKEFNPHALTVAEQGQTRGKLSELLVAIISRAYFVRNVKKTMTQLMRDDLALERALNFTASFVTLGNVMGYQPKHSIGAWTKKEDPAYHLARSEEWDHAERVEQQARKFKQGPLIRGKGTPDLAKIEAEERDNPVKHNEIEAVSVIRIKLWDRARWSGTGFMGAAGSGQPPLLALIFRDGAAGAEIFSHWRRELGATDQDDLIRITVLLGISRQHPFWYRVLVSTNFEAAKLRAESKRFMFVSRQQTMEPNTDENLRRFLADYERFGAYYLGHAAQPEGGEMFVPTGDNFILKRALHVRHAWEIPPNDPDVMGIHPDEEPVIPAEQSNPPIKETIAWLEQMKRR
ncbi:MAG: hypothetical protein HZC55_11195 [Verrucomicrobia bacterium]|nr:hypothetical protein [Verrucomicrobiota bacterium]